MLLAPVIACPSALRVGIAPAAEIVAERIDAFGAGARLVLVEERAGGRHQLLGRHPGLVVDDAVELGAEPLLEHGGLQTDHRAADHLRLVVQLVHRVDDADRAQRIGADDDEIGVGRLQRAHDRREVRRARRILPVVDDLQIELLGVLAGAFARVVGKLRVLGGKRDRGRLRVLLKRDLIEALGEGRSWCPGRSAAPRSISDT